MLLLSIVAFIFLLSFLVILHEAGHFLAARRCGVVVEEFGFGLPPRAVTLFTWRGTRFSLNWIPFGGFVRLKGESADEERDVTAPGSIGGASIPARILILSAGVIMNFLLAIVLFTIGFSAGRWIPTYVTFEEMLAAAERGDISMEPAVLIDAVQPDGTAAQAGVPSNAILWQVDGQAISMPSQVASLQAGREQVRYTVLTGSGFTEERTYQVTVREGKTGVALVPFPRHLSAPAHTLPEALFLALREVKIMTVQTVLGIAQLFGSLAQSGTVPQGVTGIVGIAQLTYASVQEGFMTYLRLVALLSLSLAVLNILPFPALDGGRLAFVLVEAVRGRAANRRFELATNMIGFIALIALIAVITYFDILRLLFRRG